MGSITPGSIPPHSTTVAEEGIIFDNFLLVEQGDFQETAVRNYLLNHPYPSRNPDQNIADFKAQIAANERGVQELGKMVNQYGLTTVQIYMQFVQDNAEESVRKRLMSSKMVHLFMKWIAVQKFKLQ